MDFWKDFGWILEGVQKDFGRIGAPIGRLKCSLGFSVGSTVSLSKTPTRRCTAGRNTSGGPRLMRSGIRGT
eukprot:865173-Karenia_brevis.AAC.1